MDERTFRLSRSGPHRAARTLGALALVGLLGLPGCFNSNQGGSNVPGTGKAVLNLERAEWGRLVDLFDRDGFEVEKNIVIRESLQSDGVNYTLSRNPVTEAEVLTINQPQASPLFDTLLRQAVTGRAGIVKKGLADPPTFTRIARNGAIRLEFSELIDPGSVNKLTVQVLVGDPPAVSQDVRYIVKNNVIGDDGKPKGVIILDPTISKFDQAQLGIPENAVGYIASFDQINPNLVIRIPTELDPLFGQTQILRNKGRNRGLSPTASDPVELSPSLDPIVVRAMRTGNQDDPFNGFSIDLQRPSLITQLPVTIANVADTGGLRTLTYKIEVPNCSTIRPKVGDIFEASGSVVLISKVDDGSNPQAYRVTGSLLSGNLPLGAQSLSGRITTPYTLQDAPQQLCWVTFSPNPGEPPGGEVDPYSSMTVRFDEPIDVSTVRSLETMVCCSYEVDPPGEDPTRQFGGPVNGVPQPETVADYIDRQIGFSVDGSGGRVLFGPVEVSADARTFTMTPSAGLTDSNADQILNLCLALRDGPDGILDLSGNPVGFTNFVAGNIDQNNLVTLAGLPQNWPTDRYFSLRANSIDEDNDGLPEYQGQFVPGPGVLRPRDLIRFSRVADPSNPFVGQRIAFSQGIMTPLTPAGAVLMTLYRYIDFGLGLLAPSEYNLDVEGMSWSPFGGNVFDDTFDRYSLALSHSERSPDEQISQSSGYPSFPQSGLLRTVDFDQNILGFPTLDEKIVFDTATYPINQVNLFTAVSGSSPMYPWPDFTDTYTWRDTSISQDWVGGASSGGIPPRVVGGGITYRANNVPSVGLPLLTRMRCYPRGAFFGSNGFQVQIMVGSSALPAFRVFSAGGRDSGNRWQLCIPDNPSARGTRPVGGFNTQTGAPTKNHGPELYWAQADFVTRISRVFTHWFALGSAPIQISNLTLEPGPELQAPGTSILVEVRGTVDVNINGCSLQDDPTPLTDSSCLDAYGDHDKILAPPPECCGSVNSPGAWTTNVQSLVTNGHRYFQLRLTFVSNIEQNLSPEMDAFGFAWNVQ